MMTVHAAGDNLAIVYGKLIVDSSFKDPQAARIILSLFLIYCHSSVTSSAALAS